MISDNQDAQCAEPLENECPEQEMDQLVDALAARFEELTLIREFSASLDLDQNLKEIVFSLIDELTPCIEAETIAISIPEDTESKTLGVFTFAGAEIDRERFDAMQAFTMEKSFGGATAAAIANFRAPGSKVETRALVVPIARSEKIFGHMLAIRDADGDEFGTVEADLMKSTAVILAVHLINQRQYSQLHQMLESTIQAFVCAIDAKDPYTHGHSTRVCNLSIEIAKRLGYTKPELNNIRMGAVLHDIGKIGVEDSVLRKPTKLTDEEYDKIKAHPVIGFEIIKGIPQFRPFLPAIRSHHECWDGSGYPDGLAGKEIPRDAQIVAVADAFDAMTSDRPYRNGMSLEKVTSILKEGRGTQWASDVVDALLGAPEIMLASMRAARQRSPEAH